MLTQYIRAAMSRAKYEILPDDAVSRAERTRTLRRLGFTEPRSGGKHQYMRRGRDTVRIPNPHRGDIGRDLLARVLRQAGMAKRAWERL